MSMIINIAMVAFGLGFVIFLHELGHFALAKWNGVKVEKFSIGFGPTLLGFTKGETEYVIAAIPLGGFVKMLGEGPEEEASKSSDPRAFPNKSVGARMAIISAGVIMNLFLGLACFVYAYGQGMKERPAIFGTVMAGSPAYMAGIQPGDELVEMDGRTDLTFNAMRLHVSLSGEGQKLHFKVKRRGHDGLIPIDVEARREPNRDAPTIGISESAGLTLANPPFRTPVGLANDSTQPWSVLKVDDEIKSVSLSADANAEKIPVEDAQSLFTLLAKHEAVPLTFHLLRKPEAKSKESTGETVLSVTLPPNRFLDFGFRLTIEPISTIRPGSPADKAGFREGDRIVKVNGQADFDPVRLPSLCHDSAGSPMTFEVQRGTAGDSPLTLTVTPDETPPWTEFPIPGESLDVSGLGLAYPVRTLIAAVRPGSPADKAGLKVGNIINAMTYPPEPDDKGFFAKLFRWFGSKKKPTPVPFNEKSPNWPYAFQALQVILQPGESVLLKVNNADKPVSIAPEPDSTWYHPLRGLELQGLFAQTPPMSVSNALKRGFNDTIDNILSIYLMLRRLFQGRVGMGGLGGPILISQVAYQAAGQGMTDLIHFLGMLSINLAVLNFMPIPPLDGGQMVYLIAEKVRGRPLPDVALIAGTYVGIFLVLALMVFVLYQDVSRLVTMYF